MMTGSIAAEADTILAFWFEETAAERRFAADPAFDAEIARRFGPLRATVLATHAAGWRCSADTRLAAILLLDQFSRNILRGQAAAFAADPLARALANEGIVAGDGARLAAERAVFLFMPLMHGETMTDQLRSIAAYEAIGLEVQIDYARRHAAQVARFGRFPGRNAALGRTGTPAEIAALAAGAAF